MDAQQGPGGHHPDMGGQNMPQNEDPVVIKSSFSAVYTLLADYGWFLVLCVALLLFLKQKFAPTIDEYRRKKEEQSYLNVDPDTARRRQEGMEAARQRMQEIHEAKAAQYAEQAKQKEEEKRQAKIEDWERHQQGGGYRSKYKPTEAGTSAGSDSTQTVKSKKPTYRNSDYNPLMGGSSGGSTTFRPPRRGGGG